MNYKEIFLWIAFILISFSLALYINLSIVKDYTRTKARINTLEEKVKLIEQEMWYGEIYKEGEKPLKQSARYTSITFIVTSPTKDIKTSKICVSDKGLPGKAIDDDADFDIQLSMFFEKVFDVRFDSYNCKRVFTESKELQPYGPYNPARVQISNIVYEVVWPTEIKLNSKYRWITYEEAQKILYSNDLETLDSKITIDGIEKEKK